MTKSGFEKHAMALYEFCEYPAVRYNILYTLLDVPYEDAWLTELRKEFLKSDIVEELYQCQDTNGGRGRRSLGLGTSDK